MKCLCAGLGLKDSALQGAFPFPSLGKRPVLCGRQHLRLWDGGVVPNWDANSSNWLQKQGKMSYTSENYWNSEKAETICSILLKDIKLGLSVREIMILGQIFFGRGNKILKSTTNYFHTNQVCHIWSCQRRALVLAAAMGGLGPPKSSLNVAGSTCKDVKPKGEDGEMVKYPFYALGEGGVRGLGLSQARGRDVVAGITTPGMELEQEMHPDSSAEGLQMRSTAGQDSR